MKHLSTKFRLVSGLFFARPSFSASGVGCTFHFSQGSVVLAQRKELPANSIERMLNSMRASGRLPVSSNTLGENPAVLASLQASWTAGAASPAVARYAFAQVGEDLYVISGEGASRTSHHGQTLQRDDECLDDACANSCRLRSAGGRLFFFRQQNLRGRWLNRKLDPRLRHSD